MPRLAVMTLHPGYWLALKVLRGPADSYFCEPYPPDNVPGADARLYSHKSAALRVQDYQPVPPEHQTMSMRPN